jgi:hypothetical protein
MARVSDKGAKAKSGNSRSKSGLPPSVENSRSISATMVAPSSGPKFEASLDSAARRGLEGSAARSCTKRRSAVWRSAQSRSVKGATSDKAARGSREDLEGWTSKSVIVKQRVCTGLGKATQKPPPSKIASRGSAGSSATRSLPSENESKTLVGTP